MTDSTLMSLQSRVKLMRSDAVGAGNFFHEAYKVSSNVTSPILYGNHTRSGYTNSIYSYSMKDINEQLQTLAKGYCAAGVGSGSVVGIILEEGTEPLLHFLALTSVGAIPALVNNAMNVETAVQYLTHVGAQGVVANTPQALISRAGKYGAGAFTFVCRPEQIEILGKSKSASLPSRFPYEHDPSDIVGLIHSSGTTGTPKSTSIAHRQFWTGKRIRLTRFPASESDRLMSMMPHTHAGGLSYFLTAILLGLPIMAVSGWKRDVVEPLMKQFQPTMVASFPRSFVELSVEPLPTEAARDVHTWFNTGDGAHYGHISRLVSLGHQPSGLVSPWLLRSEREPPPARSGSRFIDGLGSSEMGMALFGQVTTLDSKRDSRCVGKPVSVVRKAAVLDADGTELPDGEVGFLAVDTRTRTPGYWNSPELTRSFESGRYWMTGDVALKTRDGKFYHLDRTTDVIHGQDGPIYSLLIEEAILANFIKSVVDCAVIGVWNPAKEAESPVAIVKLQSDESIADSRELLAMFNDSLSSEGLNLLAAVEIVMVPSDFPLGVTGKVLKRELRDMHRGMLGGKPA